MVVVECSTKSWSWTDSAECQAQKGKQKRWKVIDLFDIQVAYCTDMQKKNNSKITTHSYSDPVDRFIICYLLFAVVATHSVVIVCMFEINLNKLNSIFISSPPLMSQFFSHVSRWHVLKWKWTTLCLQIFQR